MNEECRLECAEYVKPTRKEDKALEATGASAFSCAARWTVVEQENSTRRVSRMGMLLKKFENFVAG
jgi:hypothetical protein